MADEIPAERFPLSWRRLRLPQNYSFHLTRPVPHAIKVNGVKTIYERIDFPDHNAGRAHPCIAPDGSYIIFDEGEREHLQISFRKKGGTWGKALDLTHSGFEPLAGVPSISHDGRYLFFKPGCRGQLDIGHGDTNRDIWWVDIKMIENFRPKE